MWIYGTVQVLVRHRKIIASAVRRAHRLLMPKMEKSLTTWLSAVGILRADCLAEWIEQLL